MGSTGSGFLGLAREMAEYLTYLQYLATQDRKTNCQDHWRCIVTYQTIEHSPFHFSEKLSISFVGTYLPGTLPSLPH